MEKKKSVRFALTGETKLINQFTEALKEALAKINVKDNSDFIHNNDRWEQSGGWYRDLTNPPWSQSGGWVLDLNGKIIIDKVRPNEIVLKDVWNAFNRANPDSVKGWEKALDSLPDPKGGIRE